MSCVLQRVFGGRTIQYVVPMVGHLDVGCIWYGTTHGNAKQLFELHVLLKT